MKCTTCSAVVRPIVVSDIDGTLGDYHGHFFNFAALWLGEAVTAGSVPSRAQQWVRDYSGREDLATFMGLDKETYRKIKLAYRQGGMKRWMPMHIYADRFLAFARTMGCEIWIATTRPYNRLDNIDPDTQEFLGRNRLVFDHLLYGEDKYIRLVDQVDRDRVVMVLEDLPDLWHQAHGLGLPVVQYQTRYNEAHRLRPGVHDFEEATRLLHERLEAWGR